MTADDPTERGTRSQLPFGARAEQLLRDGLTGRLALPGDPAYDLGRAWNLTITTRPAAVVVAADVDDVATTVRWATREGLRVAVHATGHGTAGCGDDVVVVHTGRLRDCTVDADRRSAVIAAGVRAADLVEAADAARLVPIIGSNAGVGIVGYLSGGGIGPLVSTHGLSCDHVRAVEVVTGDGLRYRATADEHADLFWGVRGGRSALGIVTRVELDLARLPSLCGGILRFEAADAEVVAHQWAGWSATVPDATTSLVLTYPPGTDAGGGPTVEIRFVTPDGIARADELLEPIRGVATPVLDTVACTSYGGVIEWFDEPREPVAVQQDHALLDVLPSAAIGAILAHAGPPAAGPMTVEIRRLGGRLSRPPAHASAFSFRGAPYLINVIAGSTDDTAADTQTHVRALLAALGAWSSDATLLNFAGTRDRDDTARTFDDVTRQRLSSIARRYDPSGTFVAQG